jgi:GNAT superfamily N-acetyltransferase
VSPRAPRPAGRGADGGPTRTRRRPARVQLRAATPADAPAMARVMRAAVRGQAGRYPARLLVAWGGLPALYHRWALAAGGEVRVVALRADRIVGFAGARGGEVTTLFVHPAAAGHGTGARLLSAVEALARRAGTRRLTLLAARAAVPFYEAHGWRAVGAAPSPLPGGLALPSSRMVKHP